MDGLPVIHLCLFGCGLVVNSAPTGQSGLSLTPWQPMVLEVFSKGLKISIDKLLRIWKVEGELTGISAGMIWVEKGKEPDD